MAVQMNDESGNDKQFAFEAQEQVETLANVETNSKTQCGCVSDRERNTQTLCASCKTGCEVKGCRECKKANRKVKRQTKRIAKRFLILLISSLASIIGAISYFYFNTKDCDRTLQEEYNRKVMESSRLYWGVYALALFYIVFHFVWLNLLRCTRLFKRQIMSTNR